MKKSIFMTIVLIDGCSFAFYRVTATFSWLKKTGKTAEDDELYQILKRQALQNLKKLSDKCGIPVNQFVLVQDCPIDEIWRRQIFPAYKSNRSNNNNYGKYIRWIKYNLKNYYAKVLQVPTAEADDIIATITMYHAEFDNQKIIILSGDRDFVQLLKYPYVELYDPKSITKIMIDDPPKFLQDKIRKGDPSDAINASLELSLKQKLIDLSMIPDDLQIDIIEKYLEAEVEAERSKNTG